MTKARIKYQHWLPRAISVFFPIYAITIGRYILVTGNHLNKITWTHEIHHVNQITEYGFFTFYISYFFYYLAGLIRHRKHYEAYLSIPYEVDAYRVGNGLTSIDYRLLKYDNETFPADTGSGDVPGRDPANYS